MSTPPASAAIASELRHLIESGELAPGDRLPSTREITRRWSVAMATASKALARLRADGLSVVVPGVGTVVGAPAQTPAPTAPHATVPAVRREPRSGETGLSVPVVVSAATRIADTEGLAALSMRRVAGELGVAPMSLYRYVADKDALLFAISDAALDQWRPDDEPAPTPRAALEQLAEDLWATYLRHPWLATTLSATRPQALPGGLRFSDRLLSVLLTLQPDPATAFTDYLVLFNFVRGIAVNLEPERQAEADTGLTADEWMDTQTPALQAAAGRRDVPVFTHVLDELARTGYAFDLDRVFRTGLRSLLDGLLGRAVTLS